MFRPFLPGGFAYGSAYALPMALPMAFHALFPAEGIPPGCLYCTISARCLSTGFGRISAAFAFFRRRGVPPCRGGLLRRCRLGGRWRRPAGGGVLSLSPAYPAFSLLYRPLSPQPPSPAGKGETKVIFMQGASPLASPGLDGTRHWLCLWKTDSCGFEWSVGTRRGGGNPDCKKPLPLCICMAGFISAASGSVQGCRGRSPRRNKL